MPVTRRTIALVPVVFPLAAALLNATPLGAQAQLQETVAKSVTAPAFFDTPARWRWAHCTRGQPRHLRSWTRRDPPLLRRPAVRPAGAVPTPSRAAS